MAVCMQSKGQHLLNILSRWLLLMEGMQVGPSASMKVIIVRAFCLPPEEHFLPSKWSCSDRLCFCIIERVKVSTGLGSAPVESPQS